MRHGISKYTPGNNLKCSLNILPYAFADLFKEYEGNFFKKGEGFRRFR
jgi:hypothetical protein